MSLLHKHEVNIIVDVRSIPLCRYVLQFNQKPLSKYLQGKGVKYLYLGNELGGRRSDCINENGQVDFGQAIHSDSFLKGVKQVNELLDDGLRIALMCSEANPLRCHRFSLVARYFHEHGVDVQHILSDGKVKSHVELEREMIGHIHRAICPRQLFLDVYPCLQRPHLARCFEEACQVQDGIHVSGTLL